MKYFLILIVSFIAGTGEADTSSNINLATAGSHTVTGVYLQGLAAGACSGSTVFSNPASSSFGSLWTTGVSMNNTSTDIGANYLYQMIYTAIYSGYQDGGSINLLTTPGANSYNSGSNAWCIRLGIAAGTPVIPNASVTTSLLAFGSSSSISITCDDATLSCVAGSPTTQNF